MPPLKVTLWEHGHLRANECVGGFSFSLKQLSSVTREYGWYQLLPEAMGRGKNEFLTESDNIDASNLIRTASGDAGSRANLSALPAASLGEPNGGGGGAAAASTADPAALSSEDLSSRFGARPTKHSPLAQRKDAVSADEHKGEGGDAKKAKKAEEAEAKAAKKAEAAEAAKKEREAKAAKKAEAEATKKAEAEAAKQAKKDAKNKKGDGASVEPRASGGGGDAPGPAPATPVSASAASTLSHVQPITTASSALRRSGSMTSLVSVAAEDVVSSDKVRGALHMSVEVVAAAKRPSHLASGGGGKPPKHDAVVVTVRDCESLTASAPYLKAYLSKNGVDVKRTKTKGDYGAKGSHKLPLPTMLEIDIPSALAVRSFLGGGGGGVYCARVLWACLL